MIGLLITILIFALIVYLGFYIIGQMNLPAPGALIARVIFGIICLLILAQALGAHYGGIYFRY